MSGFAAALASLTAGRSIGEAGARDVVARMLTGELRDEKTARLLGAWAHLGESAAEVLGAAGAMREAMVCFSHGAGSAVDTCGTGGDGLGMFNVSTAAAIVAAAAGATVVKHGNRGVSSGCGSADVLEAAGMPLDLTPEASLAVMEEVGVVFLFAPVYHPAMRAVAQARRLLGKPSIFNLLGPLCNPGRVKRQVLGVASLERVEDFGALMALLGVERGYALHGAGGADELTLAGPNHVVPVGDAPDDDFSPAAVGLPAAGLAELVGGTAQENLELLEGTLSGHREGAANTVSLNAAAALVAAGVAAGAAEGVELACEAISTGRALSKWRAWLDAAQGRRGQ